MGQPAAFARKFGVTYVPLALALSYFAISPSSKEGGTITYLVTVTWMLILAGIVTTYALLLVLHGGDEHAQTTSSE